MRAWLLPRIAALAAAAPLRAADNPPKTTTVEATRAVEIPYRLTETQHVMVRVKLNGKGPFNFILDTGAPALFVASKVGKAAGGKPDDKGWTTFDRFELEGGLVLDKVPGRVEDLFQLKGMNGMGLAGVELHGVIGYNVLARFKIQYDFTADKLVFTPLPKFDPGASALILGILIFHAPVEPVRVEPVPVLVESVAVEPVLVDLFVRVVVSALVPVLLGLVREPLLIASPPEELPGGC